MSYDPDHFTSHSNRAVSQSLEFARDNQNIDLTPLHLAHVLYNQADGLATQLVHRANVQFSEVSSSINRALKRLTRQDPAPVNISPNSSFMKVLKNSTQIAKQQKDSHVAIDHLLISLYEDNDVSTALSSAGLTKRKLQEAIKSMRGSRKVTSSNAESNYEALAKYGNDLVKDAEDGKLDPVIGRDNEIRRIIQVLSRRTKNNPVLIGHPGTGKTAVVEGLAQRIVRGDVPDTLRNRRVWSLDMGSLVAGASMRGEFEERLKSVLKEVQQANGQIIMFIDEIHLVLGAGQTSGAMDAANLLKPMLARGELRCIGATTLDEYRKYIEKDPAFERRFQQVQVNEPSVADTVSILRGLKERYELHHGVRISDAALVVAAQLATRYITNRYLPDKAIDLVDEACANTRVQLDSQPEVIDRLERRQLQLDVEATALSQEKDEQSQQRLQEVKEELAKINEELKPLQLQHEAEKNRVEGLRGLKRKLESLQVKMQQAEREHNLALVADLRYGAIPELEKKIAQVELELQQQNEQDQDRMLSETVGTEQIAEIVSRWTGIPVTKLGQTERERLLNLGSHLHQRLIGQDEAVDAVAEAILRSRAGLSRSNQPLGSFLFLGPTGTGKTELAKALAEELFDDEKNTVRIDMSEYSEQHSVARLIGAPPGYVGYDQGGQLTEAIRRKPYSVLLLDEVEKAHSQVWNIFLQVLDEGRLTDGKGRTVDFTNTVIILTSNIGATYMLEGIDKKTGKLSSGVRDLVLKEIRNHFRPEFLNRLDDIVLFEPLSVNQLSSIIKLQIRGLAKRLAEQEISLDITDRAAQNILRQSYTPEFGARPLKRYLEKHVTTEISRMIISGKLRPKSIVTIDTREDGSLTYNSQKITSSRDSSLERDQQKQINGKQHSNGLPTKRSYKDIDSQKMDIY